MEWMHISVLILAGSGAEIPPSTGTVYSERFSTIEACEADLIQMRLNANGTARKVKTGGVFVSGDYEQLVVSTPVNLVGYGKGISHISCIPVSGN
jgi:hypothetical protein